MKTQNRIITGTFATLATFSLLVPTAAFAAPQSSTGGTTVSATSLEASSTQEFATTLEAVFTKAIVLDNSGIVSIDENELRSILGDEEASKVIIQISAAPQSSGKAGTLNTARAASNRSFVDCMIDSSVLGLIGGMSSGIYAELIREKKFYELAEKIMPRLIKAGVAGGVAGVVGGLAVSAIVCSRE